MPCQVEEYPSGVTLWEYQRLIERGNKIADKATYQADVLREEIINNNLQIDVINNIVDNINENNNDWLMSVNHLIDKGTRSYTYNPNGVDMKKLQQAVTITKKTVNELNQAYKNWYTLKNGGNITAAKRKAILNKQVKHRQEDLNRLMRVFAEKYAKAPIARKKEWEDKIQLVLRADINKTLEPQLGFDVDSY